MKACTAHHYVTDGSGRTVSRHCVYCGQARWVSTIKATLGIKASVPVLTVEQVANRAEWDALNTPISATPEPQHVAA